MNEGFGDEHACLFDEPSRKSPEERIDPACEGVEARLSRYLHLNPIRKKRARSGLLILEFQTI